MPQQIGPLARQIGPLVLPIGPLAHWAHQDKVNFLDELQCSFKYLDADLTDHDIWAPGWEMCILDRSTLGNTDIFKSTSTNCWQSISNNNNMNSTSKYSPIMLCVLVLVYLWLRGPKFPGAQFARAQFDGAQFAAERFSGAKFAGTQFDAKITWGPICQN